MLNGILVTHIRCYIVGFNTGRCQRAGQLTYIDWLPAPCAEVIGQPDCRAVRFDY